MNNKSFYSKMGFDTLLDYCYAVGNISLEKLTEIYYKSFGRRNEFDEIFFYDILEPIYNNIQEYIKPSTRSEKIGDEIFIAMLNLEKITEPYSKYTTYQNIRYYLDKHYESYGTKSTEVIDDMNNTNWNAAI